MRRIGTEMLRFSRSRVPVGSTGRMVALLAASNVGSSILLVGSGLLVANWLSPTLYGTFNFYSMLANYVTLAQLGVPMALGRNYPMYIGKGDSDRAFFQVQVSHAWALLLCLLVTLIALAGCFVLLLQEDYHAAAGVATMAVLAAEAFYVKQYLKVLYIGNRAFDRLSAINIITALVGALSVFFVYLYGFYGMCIRACFMALVGYILAFYWRPVRRAPVWSFDELKRILRIGFPMFAVSNLYSLWPLLQRTLVAYWGGVYYLGLYSVAAMVLQTMEALTSAVNGVIYPTMSRRWGEGGNVKDLLNVTIKPVLGVSTILLLVLPICWYLLPQVISIFLPEYIDAAGACRWMLLAGLFSVFSVWTNVYNVVGAQKAKLATFLFGIACSVVFLLLVMGTKGFSLEAFPQALIVGYSVIMIRNLYFFLNYDSATRID